MQILQTQQSNELEEGSEQGNINILFLSGILTKKPIRGAKAKGFLSVIEWEGR